MPRLQEGEEGRSLKLKERTRDQETHGPSPGDVRLQWGLEQSCRESIGSTNVSAIQCFLLCLEPTIALLQADDNRWSAPASLCWSSLSYRTLVSTFVFLTLLDAHLLLLLLLILLPQEPPPELQACCWRRTTRKKPQRHLLLFILSDGNNTRSRAVRIQAQQETGRVVVVRHGWLASGIQMHAAHMKNALKAWHKTVIIRRTKDVTEEYTPDLLPQAAKKPKKKKKTNKTIKRKQYYKREMKTQLSFQTHMIASGLLLLHKIRRVQIKKSCQRTEISWMLLLPQLENKKC